MNDENLKPFKKGADPRRNTKGSRPSATVLLNKLLSGKISIEDAQGKFHELDKDEAIWVGIIADAVDADTDSATRHRAANMVFDRLYGKPTQPVEVAGNPDSPIMFAHLTKEEKVQLLALMEKIMPEDAEGE